MFSSATTFQLRAEVLETWVVETEPLSLFIFFFLLGSLFLQLLVKPECLFIYFLSFFRFHVFIYAMRIHNTKQLVGQS